MNPSVNSLIKDFKKALQPLKKEIYSLVFHGSGFYSDKLKKNQDLDLLLVLNNYDFAVLEKLKKILKKFCDDKSNNKKFVYYSIAGDGRGTIKKSHASGKQVYIFEIFVESKQSLFTNVKYNLAFYYSLATNSTILMGKDFRPICKFGGYVGNLKTHSKNFAKLQWMYCSVLEGGYNEKLIRDVCQETVFNFLRSLLESYGIKENSKDLLINVFKNKFSTEYGKFKNLLIETQNLRQSKKPKIKVSDYLYMTKNFSKFIEDNIYERAR